MLKIWLDYKYTLKRVLKNHLLHKAPRRKLRNISAILVLKNVKHLLVPEEVDDLKSFSKEAVFIMDKQAQLLSCLCEFLITQGEMCCSRFLRAARKSSCIYKPTWNHVTFPWTGKHLQFYLHIATATFLKTSFEHKKFAISHKEKHKIYLTHTKKKWVFFFSLLRTGKIKFT
jgi:hypothetical protein